MLLNYILVGAILVEMFTQLIDIDLDFIANFGYHVKQ